MKHTIEIHIHVSEMLYDVQQRTYLIGESLRSADNSALAAQVQEVLGESGNTILRSFGKSFAVVRDALREYLVSEKHDADNILMSEDAEVPTALTFGYRGRPSTSEDAGYTAENTLVLLLRMPTNFAMDSRESIAKNIHSYMVDCAMADWLSLTPARDLAAQYTESSAADMMLIRDAVNARQRPNRVHAPSADEPHTHDMRYE